MRCKVNNAHGHDLNLFYKKVLIASACFFRRLRTREVDRGGTREEHVPARLIFQGAIV